MFSSLFQFTDSDQRSFASFLMGLFNITESSTRSKRSPNEKTKQKNKETNILLSFQQQNNRAQAIDGDETGPQGDDKVVNATGGSLCCNDDQLVVPSLIVGVFVGTVFTVLQKTISIMKLV